MDEPLWEVLQLNRHKFLQIDVEHILPFLRKTGLLSNEDVELIRRHSPCQGMHALLDIIPSKGPQAFQTLCLALESTSPHLLTILLLDALQCNALSSSRHGSLPTGLTSESECDEKKSSAPSGGASLGGSGEGTPGVPQKAFVSQAASVVSSHDYNMEQSQVALLRAELKILTKDRDCLKKELKKVCRERDDAVTRLQDASQQLADSSYGTLTKLGSVSLSDKNISSARDIETLQILNQALKKQVIDLTAKLDNAEFFRKQEHATYQKLKSHIEELSADKRKLEHEVASLQAILDEDQKEISELRRQHFQEAMNDGSSGSLNQLYASTIRKYESMKEDFDALRKRYSDLVASHSSNISKLELAQEEVSRMKKQYEIVAAERNAALREKNCLTQQCTESIRRWDAAMREKNKLQEEILKIREKYDETMKEMNNHVIQRQHYNKELKRLQEERNSAMQEYSLVMSERDNVHEEINKLQEELSLANKKIKNIEQESMEKESLMLHIETFKREIAAALADRDKALKECHELRERFGAKDDSIKKWELSYKDYDSCKQDREMKLKDTSPLSSNVHEIYSKAQKERLDNLDQANQEIDRMRKSVDKLQNELKEARQEAEVSKRRRDWAFSERDKIVLERESIRAHCDNLRRERDRAVSELAVSLRDSDDMKRQRNEASKELKEAKELLEAEQEKNAHQFSGLNRSRDSAIDSDTTDWEIDTVHFQTANLSEVSIGFEVARGHDDSHYGGKEGGFYVTSITKDSQFYGRLKLYDQILKVNGMECKNVELSDIYKTTAMSVNGWVNMTIRRRKSGSGRSICTVHLHSPHNVSHGLLLLTGVYIADILPGSPAYQDRNLNIGDRILNINGKTLEDMNCKDAQKLLDSSVAAIHLTILRTNSSSLSAPLSSSSSGHNITEDDKSISSSKVYSVSGSISKDTLSSSNSKEGCRTLSRACASEHVESASTCSSKKYDSSERIIYHTAKMTSNEKVSGPFSHFRNIVRSRRQSRERDIRQDEEEDDRKKMETTNYDAAFTKLDSVSDLYGKKCDKVKRSKKREKENNGGTWPKYKGHLSPFNFTPDPVIHAHKPRERPPLSLYFPMAAASEYSEIKPYGKCEQKHGSNHLSHFHYLDSYKVSDSCGRSCSGQPCPHSSTGRYSSSHSYYSDVQNICNPSLDCKSGELDLPDSLTSSGTSIDFSVRSGNVGKEELEYYKKKNRAKYPQSDSECISPVDNSLSQPLSLPVVYGSQSPPVHLQSDPLSVQSLSPHSYSGLYTPPNLNFRSTSFSPVSHYQLLQHSHSHPHTSVAASFSCTSPRYSSPLTFPPVTIMPSRSGDSILSFSASGSRDGIPGDNHSYSSTGGNVSHMNSYYRSASPYETIRPKSRIFHSHSNQMPVDDSLEFQSSGPSSFAGYMHSSSTIPRRKDDIRISQKINGSTSSQACVNTISSSAEAIQGRGSHKLIHITYSVFSPPSPDTVWHQELHPGDIRSIYIEKSTEPLGIQICCLENGGVYVSSVTKNSIAFQVGLRIGDQLLEVCGINMRTANKELASTFLSQCRDSVTMLVQYNPDKYYGYEESNRGVCSRSATPTPQNSPKSVVRNESVKVDCEEDLPQSGTSTLRSPLDLRDSLESSLPPSTRSTLTRSQINHVVNTLKRQENLSSHIGADNRHNIEEEGNSPASSSSCGTDARLVHLEPNKSRNLGIQMVGGNAMGIFVHNVAPDSPAAKAGLRIGDRILKYNGVELYSATAEQAAFQLAKPCDSVTMLVQYDYKTYEKCKDQAGDSFYVKALFDYVESGDQQELRFKKDDILYVDNTMHNNIPGQWRAWLVDEDGHKRKFGVIPSKDKVEEEMLLQKSSGDLNMDNSRRGSTSARRSIFRRKKHSRSSSRDSRELASFSDVSLNSYSEAQTVHDDPLPMAYLRVERLDYLVRRPVLLMGPMWEQVGQKLEQDFPHLFKRCIPEVTHSSSTELDKAVLDGNVIDYHRKGLHYTATFVAQVKEICDKGFHAILDISPASVERLHQQNIYPVVILLKFRHHKHIREVCESYHPAAEKISQKEAKELIEQAAKVEQDYKDVISAVIPAGVNITCVDTRVKDCVDQEQSKTLWVPSGSV